jgi:hypothetical protein
VGAGVGRGGAAQREVMQMAIFAGSHTFFAPRRGMAPAAWWALPLAACVALLAGAANSFTTKVLMVTPCDSSCSQSPSPSPSSTPFAKPVFSTALAFAAMALSLLWPLARCLCCGGRGQQGGRTSGGSGSTGGSTAGGGGELRSGLSALLLEDGGADDPYNLALLASLNNSGGGGSGGGGQEGEGEDERDRGRGRDRGRATPASDLCSRTPGAAVLFYAPLVVPTLLDVTATALQAAAVLFISAGVNAALRGTLLLFTAGATVCVKGKESRAGWGEWLGISISAMGAIGVGMSAFLDAETTAAATSATAQAAGVGGWSAQEVTSLGVGLSTLSNLVQGLQVAYETRFLEEGRYSAMETNGVEGVVGTAVTVAALALFQAVPPGSLGGSDNGRIEDSAETLCCLARTPAVGEISAALVAQFALSTAGYMLLSALRGANFRALLMVARGALVWGVELGFYYAWPDESVYGVPWGDYGFVAAIGFGAMGVGGFLTWGAQSARERHEREEEEDGKGEVECGFGDAGEGWDGDGDEVWEGEEEALVRSAGGRGAGGGAAPPRSGSSGRKKGRR